MDEKPKSIWRKPWPGKHGLFLWFSLFLAATFLIMLSVGYLSDMPYPLGELVFHSFLYAIGSAFGGTLLVAFIFWVCRWRNLKRLLFGLACFATLAALFYAEENWRGRRAWENCQREWEAKGEHFDFASIIPPPVPDEKNFALTPVMVSSYGFILTHDGKFIPDEQRDKNWVNRLQFNLGDNDWMTNGTGYWVKGTLSNLRMWQEHYRELAAKTNEFAVPAQPQSPAADVLLALGKYDATIEEIRQASELPECRFPLNYDTENPAMIFLPHLAALKRTSRLLQLRALAELENGQSDKACEDVVLSLRLAQFIRNEPTLIDMLVRIAMNDIITQPIYEGLAKHQWSDAQLVAMEAELAKIDYLADFNFSMRCERTFACKIIDYTSKENRVKRYHDLIDEVGNFWGGADNSPQSAAKKFFLVAGIYLMPQGWFEWNKLTVAQMHEQWLLHITDPEKHQAMPGMMVSPVWPPVNSLFNIFARELIPDLPNAAEKSARGQIGVDLARTAIALERYRLAHGEYPESLNGLAPQFIAQVPHDVIGGAPLKYRRTGDGRFVLYSIGWNGRDDGGVMAYSASGSDRHFTFEERSGSPRFEEGDWVWQYPQR